MTETFCITVSFNVPPSEIEARSVEPQGPTKEDHKVRLTRGEGVTDWESQARVHLHSPGSEMSCSEARRACVTDLHLLSQKA